MHVYVHFSTPSMYKAMKPVPHQDSVLALSWLVI
jgi:hypothetical protein